MSLEVSFEVLRAHARPRIYLSISLSLSTSLCLSVHICLSLLADQDVTLGYFSSTMAACHHALS